ncbi:Protein of unknown function [Lactobacillus equicursoris DSM 19284 = JCM 14600 = CIP 110162]|nr:hypothetical protein [Lactobacillus equicursoris]CCK86419.1 Protein of unknown function [Lactobacillus equicursoris DSM 19284 = JCM 14600 = CIP 110162]
MKDLFDILADVAQIIVAIATTRLVIMQVKQLEKEDKNKSEKDGG